MDKKMSDKESNKYYQLVKDLKSGELPLSIVFMAIRAYVRDNERIPEGARTLLTGPEGSGYLAAQFHIIHDVIGKMELAYRRGTDTPLKKK